MYYYIMYCFYSYINPSFLFIFLIDLHYCHFIPLIIYLIHLFIIRNRFFIIQLFIFIRYYPEFIHCFIIVIKSFLEVIFNLFYFNHLNLTIIIRFLF